MAQKRRKPSPKKRRNYPGRELVEFITGLVLIFAGLVKYLYLFFQKIIYKYRESTPNKGDVRMERHGGKIIGFAVIGLLAFIFLMSSFVVIQPNERGVVVVLGKASQTPIEPGLNFVTPFISKVTRVKTANYKYSVKTIAFSQDLQSVSVVVNVVGRVIPERAVSIVVDYRDSLSDTILLPQLNDTIKEVTAQYTAEKLVKSREAVRAKIMDILRARLQQYNVYVIEDVVIENIDLSDVLERAIEEKMVQEQQAERAKFAQQQAAVEAETKIIQARGEAEALTIKGKALRANKEIIALNTVEKWNGVMPRTLVSGKNGASMTSLFINDGDK